MRTEVWSLRSGESSCSFISFLPPSHSMPRVALPTFPGQPLGAVRSGYQPGLGEIPSLGPTYDLPLPPCHQPLGLEHPCVPDVLFFF